jgi:hypothetical protein
VVSFPLFGSELKGDNFGIFSNLADNPLFGESFTSSCKSMSRCQFASNAFVEIDRAKRSNEIGMSDRRAIGRPGNDLSQQRSSGMERSSATPKSFG